MKELALELLVTVIRISFIGGLVAIFGGYVTDQKKLLKRGEIIAAYSGMILMALWLFGVEIIF
jgi:hypothetical protein